MARPVDASLACYRQLKAATGAIASDFYGAPSGRLTVLAVTGTNGKTSSAWWLAQALSNLKHEAPIPCGLVGTLGIGRPASPDGEGGALVPNGMTTPDPVLLQGSLRRFVDDGLKACVMEASSIGLQEHRLDRTAIHTAIFTNFTQDHLDYHGSMEAYWQAKRKLFDWPGLRSAVVNVDDPSGRQLADELRHAPLDLWTVSCEGQARLQATNLNYTGEGLCFEVLEGQERHRLQTRLIGQYNVANLLGVIAAMRSLGVGLAACIEVCARLGSVPGRMAFVTAPDQPVVVVDYAHTPDAIEKAVQALRPLAVDRGGQLWCLFGCGGDRDPVKRPLMGAVAARLADRVVVTSDNPRSEDPRAIIDQILSGMEGAVDVEPDRAAAIAGTVHRAAASDVILVAGKGHEDYQEVAGVRLPFSDLAHVRQSMRLRQEGRA